MRRELIASQLQYQDDSPDAWKPCFHATGEFSQADPGFPPVPTDQAEHAAVHPPDG